MIQRRGSIEGAQDEGEEDHAGHRLQAQSKEVSDNNNIEQIK